MQKNVTAALMAGCLVLAGASVAPIVIAAPVGVSTEVTTTTRYTGDSAQAHAIHAWIRDQSPEYVPLNNAQSFSVTLTGAPSDVMAMHAPGASPPAPLPARGQPGQTLTIRSDAPNGGFESWTYTYTSKGGGGSWILTAYEYKKGSLNER